MVDFFSDECLFGYFFSFGERRAEEKQQQVNAGFLSLNLHLSAFKTNLITKNLCDTLWQIYLAAELLALLFFKKIFIVI